MFDENRGETMVKRIRTTWIFIVGLLAIAYLSVNRGAAADSQQVGEIGSRVSEFSLTTYDGKTITQADLENRVTLLAFWYPT